ncbi:MAG TPA: glycosyltransferase family 39 protein [Patescibacteria group bacterium]|nr:glycosyltransferase family 39 protein [Patescibacteria group bacterium]
MTAIFIVFIIRFLLSNLPSFGFDMGTWFGWANRLNSLGLSKFYSDTDWTQYTPGYMYWLWTIGKLGWTNEFAIKIPVLLADLGVGVLIWSLIRKVNLKLAYLSFFLYTLNPVVIFDGSIWGQIDGLLTLFLFLSAYYLIEKKNFVLSVLFWSFAFLIKPQSIAVLPALLMAVLIKKFKLKEIVIAGIVGTITILILSWPFFVDDPVLGLPRLVIKMTQYYTYTSVNAFNIWSWVGMWKSDTQLFLGISLASWGAILLGSSVVLTLFSFRKKLDQKSNYYLLFAILSLCFFLFPTKVHERYLFPFFAFLLTSAGLSKSINLIGIYIVTSIASFLNLYYPYSYYYPTQLRSDFLYNLSENLTKLVGFVFLMAYFALLFWEKLPKINFPNFFWQSQILLRRTNTGFPKLSLSKKTTKIIIGLILIFAFATRVFELGSPPKEYFDEVYHAFTARSILNGDIKAWEWWNTPPEGFAYEWTHPPIAKLGMVLGMKIFGENSFGWRIPGALLGVGSVFMVYLIAKRLFDDEAIGLIAAGVFSLDGLPLVLSRIGMNDSYLLFFILLSIYLFLKEKNFASAIVFGLALASKWSAIWAIPILGVIWLRRLIKNKSFKISTLWFLVLPFLVYFLSYLPMFLSNHSLSIWWEMQKQMWWYHTGLRATHPYSSSWWSWPFLLRPIYLYTSDEVGGWVARIYSMGNPLVFWFGLTSIIMSFIYARVERNKNLGFVVFSYLIFFVPWALSPRIMFLYHYLPSIPFMCIAIAYVLRRNPKLILGYLLICLLVFIYFYPHWAGLQVPLWLDKSYYWIGSWR